VCQTVEIAILTALVKYYIDKEGADASIVEHLRYLNSLLCNAAQGRTISIFYFGWSI
jgi:hypothetical protein